MFYVFSYTFFPCTLEQLLFLKMTILPGLELETPPFVRAEQKLQNHIIANSQYHEDTLWDVSGVIYVFFFFILVGQSNFPSIFYRTQSDL